MIFVASNVCLQKRFANWSPQYCIKNVFWNLIHVFDCLCIAVKLVPIFKLGLCLENELATLTLQYRSSGFSLCTKVLADACMEFGRKSNLASLH